MVLRHEVHGAVGVGGDISVVGKLGGAAVVQGVADIGVNGVVRPLELLVHPGEHGGHLLPVQQGVGAVFGGGDAVDNVVVIGLQDVEPLGGVVDVREGGVHGDNHPVAGEGLIELHRHGGKFPPGDGARHVLAHEHVGDEPLLVGLLELQLCPLGGVGHRVILDDQTHLGQGEEGFLPPDGVVFGNVVPLQGLAAADGGVFQPVDLKVVFHVQVVVGFISVPVGEGEGLPGDPGKAGAGAVPAQPVLIFGAPGHQGLHKGLLLGGGDHRQVASPGLGIGLGLGPGHALLHQLIAVVVEDAFLDLLIGVVGLLRVESVGAGDGHVAGEDIAVQLDVLDVHGDVSRGLVDPVPGVKVIGAVGIAHRHVEGALLGVGAVGQVVELIDGLHLAALLVDSEGHAGLALLGVVVALVDPQDGVHGVLGGPGSHHQKLTEQQGGQNQGQGAPEQFHAGFLPFQFLSEQSYHERRFLVTYFFFSSKITLPSSATRRDICRRCFS